MKYFAMKVKQETSSSKSEAALKPVRSKKPYKSGQANLTGVNEPEAAAYATIRPAISRSLLRQHDQQGTLKNRTLTEYLVVASKAGRTSVQFANEGMAVHKISFDEKLDVIEGGFTKKGLLELKDRYGISSEALAKILNITNRTIQNKPMTFKFTGNVAEKILGLSEIYSYGMEVFEEQDKFRRWLQVLNPILNNRRPLELLSTQLGMQQVKHELARIDYGIY